MYLYTRKFYKVMSWAVAINSKQGHRHNRVRGEILGMHAAYRITAAFCSNCRCSDLHLHALLPARGGRVCLLGNVFFCVCKFEVFISAAIAVVLIGIYVYALVSQCPVTFKMKRHFGEEFWEFVSAAGADDDRSHPRYGALFCDQRLVSHGDRYWVYMSLHVSLYVALYVTLNASGFSWRVL